MSAPSSIQKDRVPADPVAPLSEAQSEAERHATETLVQCYWREIAEPHGLVTWSGVIDSSRDHSRSQGISDQAGGVSHPLVAAVVDTDAFVARLDFPYMRQALQVFVDRLSPLGIRHLGPVLLDAPDGPRPLEFRELARLLVEELAQRFRRPINEDLLDQIGASVRVTETILESLPRPGRIALDPMEAYVQSEQSLAYGHPFHPTPKARSGLSDQDLRSYSPELGVAFPLHYFAVRESLVIHDSRLAVSVPELVQAEGPRDSLPGPGWVLVPVHPWQAGYLKQLRGVQAAEAAGHLRDLGAYGPDFRPTASVRTLYAQNGQLFYKASLSFRITNCLRRNALAELAASLSMSRMMARLEPELRKLFPSFYPLDELGYMTIWLPDAPPDEEKAITEGFGLMLRQGLDHLSRPEVVPILAAALFGNGERGRIWIHDLLTRFRGGSGPWNERILAFFAAYLRQLLPPLLYLYGKEGLMFEPHLQNIVVGFKDGEPVAIYLRDFENARLVSERVSSQRLALFSESEQKELCYGESKAWNRFAYCLFSNHVVEVVRQLSYGQPSLEPQLWALLKETLEQFLEDFGESQAAPRIERLLSGEAFPAKTNLITRVVGGKDAEASYVDLGNPWRKPESIASGCGAERWSPKPALEMRSV